MRKQRLESITRADVERAAYIDFESREAGPITLLGVFVPDAPEPLRQFILDPVFAPMVGHTSPSVTWPVGLLDPAGALDLLAGLRAEGRRLFAWSDHEQQVVGGLADETGHDAGIVPTDIEDAKAHAKRWKRRVHPEVEFPKPARGRPHTLYNYEALIGVDRAPIWAGNSTGDRIDKVGRRLRRGVAPGDLTAVQKGYWTNLLIHNRLDCEGVHRVLAEVAG